MLAKRKIARMVVIASLIMFALIAAFFKWAAVGEANGIGAPINTSMVGSASTQSMATPSPTP